MPDGVLGGNKVTIIRRISMLSIYICEDELMQKEKLEKLVKDYIMTKGLDMEMVLATDNPIAILNHVQENSEIGGLYFLDVALNHEMDGIALALQIRELDPSGKIVFLTVHGELAYLTFKYKIEALDYIIKGTDLDTMKKKVGECIQIAHDRHLASKEPDQHYFVVKISEKINVIPVEEIMYFKVSDVRDRLVLHLENSKIQFRGFLKDVENYRPEFIRVHHAVVANKQNIESIDDSKMEIKFVNGATCCVSARKFKVLEKALIEQ